MVVIDATTLLLMLRPDTPVPAGPDGVPVEKPKERIDYLVQQLSSAKTQIIIPTPALSEALVSAGAAASQQIVEHLQKYQVFRIEPFDTKAAIEVAAMTRKAKAGGDKRGGVSASWAKVKYDRQIVAIAKVSGATTIYSDDEDVATLSRVENIEVMGVADLPLPPEDAQLKMAFPAPTTNPTGDEIDDEEAQEPA
jgi:predicted nucleic acid-binding protein